MWEKEKMLVTSNFSFSHSIFKRPILQTSKNQGLFGKELNQCTWTNEDDMKYRSAKVISTATANGILLKLHTWYFIKTAYKNNVENSLFYFHTGRELLIPLMYNVLF